MKRWLWILFVPFVLCAQTIAPPMDFSRQQKVDIDLGMDSPEALGKEAVRNQKIFAEHQFPLGFVLLVVILAVFVMVFVNQRERMAFWIKKLTTRPVSAKEKALLRLQELEKVENLSERYRLLDATLRENLKERYQIPALVSTHEEVLAKLKESKEEYRQVFHEMESVEYRNKTPSNEDYQKVKSVITKLI